MPPSRRHSRTTTPPTRRPRVAGLHRSGAGVAKPERPDLEPASLNDPAAADVAEIAEVSVPETAEPDLEPDEPTTVIDDEPPPWREPERTVVSGSVIGEPEAEPVAADTLDEPATVEEQPVRARPAGKRRAIGLRRPDDLQAAEAEAAAATTDGVRTRQNTMLSWAIAIAVVALLVAGLAVWFRGEANSRTEGADTNNQALVDPATQSEAVRQLRSAIEKTLTYNYTDLDSTAKAVQDNLSGKALCEYDQLFGEVKKLAPEQKIVLTTQVREIGVTRLEGDQAVLLVFVDQRTTRADQNQTTASGAQFDIKAQRQGDKWKITEFDMLGQPLPNGKPAPQC